MLTLNPYTIPIQDSWRAIDHLDPAGSTWRVTGTLCRNVGPMLVVGKTKSTLETYILARQQIVAVRLYSCWTATFPYLRDALSRPLHENLQPSTIDVHESVVAGVKAMATIESVLDEAQTLSPVEQLQLIQALSQTLQRRYEQRASIDTIPASVKRSQPITDLNQLAANFWPEDESADDINAFIAQQRAADRMSDL